MCNSFKSLLGARCRRLTAIRLCVCVLSEDASLPCIRQACSEYLSRCSCPAFYGLAVVHLWFEGAVRQCNDYTPATHRISTPLSGSLAKLSTSDSSLTVGGSAFPESGPPYP